MPLPDISPTCSAGRKDSDPEISHAGEVKIKEPATAKSENSAEKSAGFAVLCSFVIPGLGQIYNGEVGKGVAMLFGTFIGVIFFIIPGIVVWIYGIYDAYATADKMSKGSIPFKPNNPFNLIVFLFFGLFIEVIAFFLTLRSIVYWLE